eukprot:gene9785-10821_t
MDVVCVQDSAGVFHYTSFYVKFKIALVDQAARTILGSGGDDFSSAKSNPADNLVLPAVSDSAIAAQGQRDAEQSFPPRDGSLVTIIVNGKPVENGVIAFIGLGQLLHFFSPKTAEVSLTPPQEIFRKFSIKAGRNKVECLHRDSGCSVVFYIWFYSLEDNLVVMDIDGTITKSDLRGYIQTVYLGLFGYIHDGVVEFLHALSSRLNLKIIYLTSRPIGHRKETLSLLQNAKGRRGEPMPQGPLFMAKARLMEALYQEIVTKDTARTKGDILYHITNVFRAAGARGRSPFVLGVGNKESDALAYNSIGLPGENILLINPASTIVVWKNPKARSVFGNFLNRGLSLQDKPVSLTIDPLAPRIGRTPSFSAPASPVSTRSKTRNSGRIVREVLREEEEDLKDGGDAEEISLSSAVLPPPPAAAFVDTPPPPSPLLDEKNEFVASVKSSPNFSPRSLSPVGGHNNFLEGMALSFRSYNDPQLLPYAQKVTRELRLEEA